MKSPIERATAFAKSLLQFIKYDVWQKDFSKVSSVRRIIYHEIRIGYLVFHAYLRDRLPIRASALVYSTLLGVVPLLAVTFSLFKGFGFHLKLEPKLVQWVTPLGDKAVEMVHKLISDLDSMNLSAFGFAGLMILLVSLSSIVNNIERAFNDIWRIEHDRTIQRKFADYTGAFLFIPILLIGVPAFNTAIQTLPVISLIRHFPGLEWVLNKITPFLLVWLMFTFFYYFLPNTRVNLMSALLGAFYAGLFWQATNFYFTKFLIRSYQTGVRAALYTSFAGFLLFLLWLYLSWTVVLLGAEISYVHQNQARVRSEINRTKYSFAYREGVALEILLMISRRFLRGEPPVGRQEISESFALPERLLDKILNMLIDLRFIFEMKDEKDAKFTCARSPQKITIKDVLMGLRNHGSVVENSKTTFYHVVSKTMQNYYHHLLDKAFATQTLQDILDKEGKNRTA